MQRSSQCYYCNNQPIAKALGYEYSCADCTYVCQKCKEVTPYELGSTASDVCDECFAKHNPL